MRKIQFRSLHDLHNAGVGFFTTITFNQLFTDFMKRAFGLLRPIFINVCQYDQVTGSCTTTDKDSLADARQTFPSGHTSNGFATLTFLAFYLAGKMKPFHNRSNGMILRFVSILSGPFFALYVAATRVTNFRHFLRDISVGGLVGILCAFVAYNLFFKPLSAPDSHLPKVRTTESLRHVLFDTEPTIPESDFLL
eukprot:TRINITY_DN6248_c0_g1_i1.p1 TRINITY_DN6248_c0_g1~~TRINITY_DN6248_c0_g1_i1.p1  ORF type:complete len:194 (-),score=17.76 TRINITY_DN6248_c0_g1_i1:2-583(-)